MHVSIYSCVSSCCLVLLCSKGNILQPLIFHFSPPFIPPFLFSSSHLSPCPPPPRRPPTPPLLILLRAAIHNKDHSGRKGVCWGKTHYSFICCSFLILPFGLKSVFKKKNYSMIYWMKLASYFNEFSVIQCNAYWHQTQCILKRMQYLSIYLGKHFPLKVDFQKLATLSVWHFLSIGNIFSKLKICFLH